MDGRNGLNLKSKINCKWSVMQPISEHFGIRCLVYVHVSNFQWSLTELFLGLEDQYSLFKWLMKNHLEGTVTRESYDHGVWTILKQE